MWHNLGEIIKLRQEGRPVAAARGRIRWWGGELERTRGALGVRGLMREAAEDRNMWREKVERFAVLEQGMRHGRRQVE